MGDKQQHHLVTQRRNGNPTVRTFAPELWAEVDAFIALHSGTYKFGEREQRCLYGVRRHFQKARVFRDKAAESMAAMLAEQSEMDRQGYSEVKQGSETAQNFEASVAEYYSCLDCTAKVVRAIYGSGSRGFKDSTSFLFTTPDRITGLFPDTLKSVFAGAGWEKKLRHLHDELVHSGTGHCDLSRDAIPTIRYLHFGFKIDGKPLDLPDVIGWLDQQEDRINAFIGAVFHFLRGTLTNTPVTALCGMVGGRALAREIDPTDALITLASGKCLSTAWIEDPELPTCPFITCCGAYRRTRPDVDPAAVLASKRHPELWHDATS